MFRPLAWVRVSAYRASSAQILPIIRRQNWPFDTTSKAVRNKLVKGHNAALNVGYSRARHNPGCNGHVYVRWQKCFFRGQNVLVDQIFCNLQIVHHSARCVNYPWPQCCWFDCWFESKRASNGGLHLSAFSIAKVQKAMVVYALQCVVSNEMYRTVMKHSSIRMAAS